MAVNDYNTQVAPEYQNSIPPAMQFSDDENRIRGMNTTGVADDSFLGQSNADYQAPVEVSPDDAERDSYVQRLGAVEERYKASAWDNPVDNSYRAQVSAPTAADRVWNTMFNMGTALLLSGGNPAAMALAGFKSYTDDEDREYRYNQLDELQAQGYSLRTARDFVDTGDRRYLAEDRNGRVEAEKEQYNRDIDVRNFDEGVRQYDQGFQLDTDKFTEVKRSNEVGEQQRGQEIGISQQRANWETNPVRYAAKETDAYGNLRLFDQLGKEIAVYNGDGDLVDGKNGAKLSSTPKGSNKEQTFDLIDRQNGSVIEKVIGTPGKWRRASDNTPIKLDGTQTASQTLPDGTTMQVYGSETVDGKPRFEMMDPTRSGAYQTRVAKQEVEQGKVQKQSEKVAGQFQDIVHSIDNITDDDINEIEGGWGKHRPGALEFGKTGTSLTKFNSLGGKTFLPQFESLKGGGSITQVEGSAANAALNTLIGPNNQIIKGLPAEDYKDALKVLRTAAARKAEVERANSRGEKLTPEQLDAKIPPYYGSGYEKNNQSRFPGAPKIGTVEGGYQYGGGDPSDFSNWFPVGK